MSRTVARIAVGLLGVASVASVAGAQGAPVRSAAGGSPSAADSKVRCAAAYEQSQLLRRQDKLGAARSQLAICREACPRALSSDCTRWLDEVDALMPSVSLGATDAEGNAVDARVFLDGELIADHLTPDPVRVDSGDHTFRFEASNGAAEEVRVSVHGGERGRPVHAVLSLPVPVKAKEEARGIPPAAVGLGAAGLGGIALGGILSLVGHLEVAHLHDLCAPHCSHGQVDAIAVLYDLGWASAGVGTAALAGALFVWHPWERGEKTGRFYVTPRGRGVAIGYDLP